MNAREQKAALAETVRLTGIAPHDGETLREYPMGKTKPSPTSHGIFRDLSTRSTTPAVSTPLWAM